MRQKRYRRSHAEIRAMWLERVPEIRAWLADSISFRTIAKRYAVSPSLVEQVCRKHGLKAVRTGRPRNFNAARAREITARVAAHWGIPMGSTARSETTRLSTSPERSSRSA